MMRYLKHIVLVSLLLSSSVIMAQQLPLINIYRESAYMINPAIAGSKSTPVVTGSYRMQWLGINESPHTQALGFHMPVGVKKNIGIGASVINDLTGPTGFTALNLQYAYHIKFKKINPFLFPNMRQASRLAIGINASISQYRLQGDELVLENPFDQTIFDNNESQFMPNVGVGLYYYYDIFYVGFSIPELIGLNIKFNGDGGISTLKRELHYYTVVGASIPIGQFYKPVITLEPIAWLKAVKGAPFQLDAGLRTVYKQVIWLGVHYRTSNTLAFETGVRIKKQFSLGYSVDYTISDIGQQLGTSHEFFLSYKFKEKFRL